MSLHGRRCGAAAAPGLFVAALWFCASGFAQALPPLELPGSSRLQVLKGPASSPSVAFSGTTTVHAILVAQWVADADGAGHAGQRFQLLPVPQSAAQMPHFKGAPLKFITVRNGLAVLSRATSPSIAEGFASRATGVIHVEGVFAIKDLKIGTPCTVAGQAELVEADPVRVRFPGRAEPIECPK